MGHFLDFGVSRECHTRMGTVVLILHGRLFYFRTAEIFWRFYCRTQFCPRVETSVNLGSHCMKMEHQVWGMCSERCHM